MRLQLKMFLLAGLMAALTSVGGIIRIPMVPVPITMQSLFVILSGSLIGPFWGSLSMLIYIFLGLIGLPVFAGGSGIGIILSPTFGYLLGFPVASYFVGKKVFFLLQSAPTNFTMLKVWFYQTIGLVLIYPFGMVYLYLVKNIYVGDNLSIPTVVLQGFLVFVPGLLVKSFLASVVVLRMKNHIQFFK